jgi:hypothetical protein
MCLDQIPQELTGHCGRPPVQVVKAGTDLRVEIRRVMSCKTSFPTSFFDGARTRIPEICREREKFVGLPDFYFFRRFGFVDRCERAAKGT